MVQAALRGGLAVASFAAAAVLVFAIVGVTEYLHHDAEPAWWPEFERAFADYVRGGDGRRW